MFSRKNIALLMICAAVLCLSSCAAHKSSGDADAVHATVMDVEKYGHAVLDITTADLTAAGYALGDIVHVHFESYESDMPFFDGYYSNPGTLMLRGLTPESNIAVCINYGDFSGKAGISVGDTAIFTDSEGNQYTYTVTNLQYESHADQTTLNREESALTLFIKKVYDFELMANSGHIAGYIIDEKTAIEIDQKLLGFSDISSFK